MMKKLYVFLLLLCTGCATVPQKGTTSDWTLLWEDEFNKDGAPDPSKWSYAGRRSPDWACYCADNPEITYVKDGLLYLKAVLNQDKNDTAKYQTACIHTKDKFVFTYGKVEVRAKLSKGKGSWPAIWLMPQDSKYGGWPKSGEIDVMEHLNYDTIFYQTLHSEYIDQMNQKKNPLYFATPAFKEGEFNVFGLEWYPDRMDFFVNNQKTFTYPRIENADARQWPFDQQFYLILNQALGGNWVGTIKDEDLPVQMVVDWVRVFQMQDSQKKPVNVLK
ncbi:glycoside hydrolase family 16 protein [Rufibacter glacialis]|uniref:Glycoside hydrolase family 16 protein n=1 Tax=Rufibacter glacialis TaxID=1259555 RepID=A0A5M8QBB8_9BACT|nr:glycoside hydrolase family 16 protein [Rufibacter glacialis]KAA6432448.1 glycoside hydrolase family 16 protein [Rufibacter glacialis]GGK78730.1 beta-glucanase [Rufibacter glacialis]